jgi:YD repeat-containing protein
LATDSSTFIRKQEFDRKGSIISEIFYKRNTIDTTSTFDNGEKRDYLYNDENKSEWIEYDRTKYNYDHNGNLLSEKNKVYFSEYEYDKNNRKISKTNYFWNGDKKNWTGDYKFEWEYDNDGDIIFLTIYHYNWENDELKKTEKRERIFDKNKREIQIISEEGNGRRTKSETFYDENNNESLVIDYSFDHKTQKWKEDYRSEYFYRKANY